MKKRKFLFNSIKNSIILFKKNVKIRNAEFN